MITSCCFGWSRICLQYLRSVCDISSNTGYFNLSFISAEKLKVYSRFGFRLTIVERYRPEPQSLVEHIIGVSITIILGLLDS